MNATKHQGWLWDPVVETNIALLARSILERRWKHYDKETTLDSLIRDMNYRYLLVHKEKGDKSSGATPLQREVGGIG
jgi:hypothetical protein